MLFSPAPDSINTSLPFFTSCVIAFRNYGHTFLTFISFFRNTYFHVLMKYLFLVELDFNSKSIQVNKSRSYLISFFACLGCFFPDYLYILENY